MNINICSVIVALTNMMLASQGPKERIKLSLHKIIPDNEEEDSFDLEGLDPCSPPRPSSPSDHSTQATSARYFQLRAFSRASSSHVGGGGGDNHSSGNSSPLLKCLDQSTKPWRGPQLLSSSVGLDANDKQSQQLSTKNLIERFTTTTTIPNLSNELVNETLNYFVNCSQRLNQMTKTYDDSDAYILLLQEKEVDLELAARIGQDLLRQNKQLRESLQTLEKQLNEKQEDIQQLRHELTSKNSLLEATSLLEANDKHPTTTASSTTTNHYCCSSSNAGSRFPVRSESTQPISRDDSSSCLFEDDHFDSYNSLQSSNINHFNNYLNNNNNNNINTHNESTHLNNNQNQLLKDQQKLVESVTFRVIESNKRLCELQDELLYKCEQNHLQQEKIFQLQEQLNETDRRLCDMSTLNEDLQKSVVNCDDSKRELVEELALCRKNFNELLNAFMEMQRETRVLLFNQQQNHNQSTSHHLKNQHQEESLLDIQREHESLFHLNDTTSCFTGHHHQLYNVPSDNETNDLACEFERELRLEIDLDDEVSDLKSISNNSFNEKHRRLQETIKSLPRADKTSSFNNNNDEDADAVFQLSTNTSSTATIYLVSSILLIILAKKSYSQLTYR